MKPTGISDGPPEQSALRHPVSDSEPAPEQKLGVAGLALFERVESTAEDVRHALVRVSSDLAHLGVGEADRDAIEVVLAECMNNVVEHAYGERSDRQFELNLYLSEDGVLCRVEDRGDPMPGLSPPAGSRHDLSVELDDLPEGGFGWFLIRELTSDLHYARVNDRNRLSFRIRLGRNPR